MTTNPTLDVQDLQITGRPSDAQIVRQISLQVLPGEVLGVVGESGSGKTTLGLALLNYCKSGTYISAGSIVIDGNEITALQGNDLQALRGGTVAYIPQSPAAALNPALRIGTQLDECMPATTSPSDRAQRIREVMKEVALPEGREFLRRYPHQLSGGQQQRIAIAMAFVSRPRLIVLDEPTTGLDVTTQATVLQTVRELCQMYQCAAVYISHDMAVVAELVDHIAVMYSGSVVEFGPMEQVLARPQHPYTNRLLLAVPDLHAARPMVGIGGYAPSPMNRPGGCDFAPRCPLAEEACRTSAPEPRTIGERSFARCHRIGVPLPPPEHHTLPPETKDQSAEVLLDAKNIRGRYGKLVVLEDVSIQLRAGECLALLGESGSGKTTLSRIIAGLHREFDGDLTFRDEALAASSFSRTPTQRGRIQYIFQDPYESLNPRRTVRELVLQPLRALKQKVADPESLVAESLERVALRADMAGRYPDQLSGGERQRVAVARALVTKPEVLICDEITSALDVSVQSSLIELLQSLQIGMGLSLLFITHNIALVRNIAQRVAVLQDGEIVEVSDVKHAFTDSAHPYTRSLITSTPNLRLPQSALPVSLPARQQGDS
ncbi:peptide/nickel transport system ATP-binding protein [Antricoccus suffuscus]|uniref:Peptide/nickel transport system ATP-binding protein n=1 Tax=Antricoccus suffuscus TaxID=1629062 RepID=A0A2T0ZZA2_9ACTN|nr:ABC transporter ATP-binding protein [Antricoccus suffuscus]PRZ41689.1 peptide/nickel transport system ATP-binding protein [Antricoccus suffuscus]